MGEPSMTEKAQNEHATNNLDILSHSHSSSPYHRPDHDRPHHPHESHHLRGGHHHGESHHHRDPHQDSHDSAFAHSHHGKASPYDRAHYPTSLGWGPSSAISHSHYSYGEDHFDDERRYGSRIQHGGSHYNTESHHHVGPHHGGPHHHTESYLHVGPYHGVSHHHTESYHPSGPHHHSGSDYHGSPHHHTESYHRGGPYHHTGSDHHDGPHHHAVLDHHDGPYHHAVSDHHGGHYHHTTSYHHGGPHHHTGSDHHDGPHHHAMSDHPGGPHHHGRHHYYGGHQHHQSPGVSYQHGETSYPSRLHLPGVSQPHSEYGHDGGLHHQSPSYHHEDSYHPGGPYHHSEDYYHSGFQHHEPHQYNRLHPYEFHHHRKHLRHEESLFNQPSEESYHHGTPHFFRESYHGSHRSNEDHHGEHHRHREHRHQEHHHIAHRYDHLHGDSYRDNPRSSSQLFVQHKPHSITGSTPHLELTKSLPHNEQSHAGVRSRGSQPSNKVHPQDTASKDSESWSEDEQYQRQKRGRGQRAHKKHTMNIFQRLCEKLRNLLWGPWIIIRSLTQSLFFEAFIFLVVFLNIIMLMAQTFAEVKIRGEWYFMAFDCIFLSIYIIEALLKIISLDLEYFYDPWNNLDFFVMIMSVLDFSLMQVNSLFSFYNHSLFRILKVLKIMRALRAIRIIRRLRILTSLKEVTGTLVGSLLSIITIFILIFSCLLFFSMILTLFRRSDPWRFENFFTTMFTLFTVLTLDDWSLIYMDSRAQGAWYIIPILMIYIFIQNIIFLNLLTAVLVDNFQMALLRDEEKVKQEMTAWIHEKLLDDSLTELNQSEPEEVKSEEDTMQFMKKFGTMTEKQWEVQAQFLKLVARLEHRRKKFSSGARIIDEIVDTTFEVNQRTSRSDTGEQHQV